MSLLKKLVRPIVNVVKSPAVAAAVSVFNPAAGGALTALQSLTARPGAGIVPAMGSLPQIGGGVVRALPGMAGAAGAFAISKGRAIARGAAALCSKHPQWCSTIGGVAGVAALMESGQLPIPKRRRGRGLTPRDLRSFRRVAKLIRGFCPTVRRIPARQLHVRGTGISHA